MLSLFGREVFEGIREVVLKLKDFTAWKLVKKSHDKDGPWFAVVESKGYKADMDIEAIKNIFWRIACERQKKL